MYVYVHGVYIVCVWCVWCVWCVSAGGVLQVRALQLERDQTQMQLESVQQRSMQDTELMENAHRCVCSCVFSWLCLCVYVSGFAQGV